MTDMYGNVEVSKGLPGLYRKEIDAFKPDPVYRRFAELEREVDKLKKEIKQNGK